MPNKNDPIYKCFNGTLEVYSFIEEHIDVWTLRKCFGDKKKISTNKG